MESLQRTRAGAFGLEEAMSWQSLEEALKTGKNPLLPPARLVAHLPQVNLNQAQATDILHGRDFEAPIGTQEGWTVLRSATGAIAAMAMAEGGRLKPRKVFGPEGI